MSTADAYKNRESTSTRNPHAATKPVDAKALAKLSYDERIAKQWQAAAGCPISDEAKEQCKVFACGHVTHLADVRIWHEMQTQKGRDKSAKSTVFLEFFFDGSREELNGQESEFKAAFENMIESQLQEIRIKDFRQRLTARRRGSKVIEEDSVEGGASSSPAAGDTDWGEYIKTPAPATELSVRSMREAGCMLRFIVCQTSISTSAAELLGQTCFQEHFPINGVPQEMSKDVKPMPRWVYLLMCFAAMLVVMAMVIFWNVTKSVLNTSSVTSDLSVVVDADPVPSIEQDGRYGT
eukprot:TRINITY_DN73797_c0_g1_i1.p1 TRINITY_DN73797_c0_g1~~TRINITY_DN73797_c0_g1_i1.p1  ORF type:complete len:324 (-),score=70.30 TRINITY_DN73797_c0_g1_i1:274-1155(-)